MARKISSQLITSLERGGDGGNDMESELLEGVGDGDEVIMAVDLESHCSRRLLKYTEELDYVL